MDTAPSPLSSLRIVDVTAAVSVQTLRRVVQHDADTRPPEKDLLVWALARQESDTLDPVEFS